VKGQSAAPDTEVDVTWVGLRCQVIVRGATTHLRADLRSKAGDPNSSLVRGGKELSAAGAVSLFVEDDDREGDAAWLVVLRPDGSVCAQALTAVGGK
jgi:hypothetical protein